MRTLLTTVAVLLILTGLVQFWRASAERLLDSRGGHWGPRSVNLVYRDPASIRFENWRMIPHAPFATARTAAGRSIPPRP